jgi:hypothetical protein
LKNLPFPFCMVLESLFGVTTFPNITFSDSLKELPHWYNNLKIPHSPLYPLVPTCAKQP